ncbi:MAG: ribosomal-protein-alanine N-acetyltransferase [Spirochaetes bacterium ADurb.Bin218]|jgi:ribosomal-protein-alanine N-acetyltransferase|nr:GNAT family N-acetyltransferase [Spirochaetota bacterium]OQA96712.1 MAG: ribosomal-protein-alanine N-acetyltransferase [Spirochaetes bacterium ADurb.Bin218]HOQ13408.1 GNAT family N-acetyltransferase [Spirochaetota bacterium]HOV09104.1 GNAT family N-acetyltransferase [Spirochaetota bacterium]
MSYKIRKAEFTDIDAVWLIEQKTIGSWDYNQFLEELNRDFSIFIVAEDESIHKYDATAYPIDGYAVAWRIADEIQLNSIAVCNERQNNGIGTLIVNYIKNMGYESGARCLLLEVRSKNANALNFYKKNGFEITGKRKNYYKDDDAILMELKLR